MGACVDRRPKVLRNPDSRTVDALEALAFGLVAVTSRAIHETATPPELTFQQWRVLVVLGGTESGMRVSELAARITASGPSSSRIVRRLARRGLVESTIDPSDRRAVLLRLTHAGSTLRERIIERRRSLIRDTIARQQLSPTATSQLIRLAGLLERWI